MIARCFLGTARTVTTTAAMLGLFGTSIPTSASRTRCLASDEATQRLLQFGSEMPLLGPMSGFDRSRAPTRLPKLTWSTFLGSSAYDASSGIAVDGAGNIYVVGTSAAGWGNPVYGYVGGYDAFVAKLNASGSLTWLAFLGTSEDEFGQGIALDASSNIYVTGKSEGSWGNPVNPHSGGFDCFVAKLNGSTGSLIWTTFAGSSGEDYGSGITVDTLSNVYVAGTASAAWGAPIAPYSGGLDAFLAKFSGTTGGRTWHTFLGGTGTDAGVAVAIDSFGDPLLVGSSTGSWGSPLFSHYGGQDAFVARIWARNGGLIWHTFLGGSDSDSGQAIALDPAGNIYVAGYGNTTWGHPVNNNAGGYDAFVAKLKSSGERQWVTFMGAGTNDYGYGIAVDGLSRIIVCGYSYQSWGSPANPHSGPYDAFVAKLSDSTGALLWNTFLGSQSDDHGHGVAVDASFNVYALGDSDSTWSSPVRAFSGGRDVFVAKLSDCSTQFARKDLLGSWAGQGVYYLNYSTGAWVYVTTPASQVTAADIDGDCIDDLVGLWSGEIWIRYSTTLVWERIASSASWVTTGDLNGDGKPAIVGIFGSRIWIRDPYTHRWIPGSEGATQAVYADRDGDGKDDLLAALASGLWVKYSSTGQWQLLSAASPTWLAAGDLDGDRMADVLGIWDTNIWVFYTTQKSWTYITYAASQVAAGDLDGDGKADVIGVWPDGVWALYSSTGTWVNLATPADSITAGKMH